MKIFLIVLGVSFTGLGYAGGFDINNIWSAKYSAVGGAAASNVEGAQSIYFNPAGLSKSHALELDLNYVSAMVTKSAPLKPEGADPTKGDTPKRMPYTYLPLGGFFAAHQVNQRLGIGGGAYIAGGTGGSYDDVDFGSSFPTLRPDIDSTIFIVEFALGAGYEILPGLSIGAAWRPNFVRLDSQVAIPSDDILLAPELNHASDFILGGYRLGIQYSPNDSRWGVGAAFRSENSFEAKGKSSGKSQLAGDSTISSIQGGDVTAKAKIPMQYSLGVHFDSSQKLRFMTQYDFIRSSRVKQLTLSGDDIGVTGVGDIPISSFSSPLEWKDQHSYRFGVQYLLTEIWTVRGGYVFSSQVTPDDRASSTATSPGNEQSFIVGAGREIRVFSKLIQMDLATEYGQAYGQGKNSKAGSLDGQYSEQVFGLYTGFSYRI